MLKGDQILTIRLDHFFRPRPGVSGEKYKYSPYGEPDHTGGFPFQLTGRRHDPETGFYYYRARYYDPRTGRFLQVDPIGYEAYMNLYVYVDNDPQTLTDPSGKCPWCIAGAVLNVALEAHAIYKEGGIGEGGVGLGEAALRVGVAGATGAVGVRGGGAVGRFVLNKARQATGRGTQRAVAQRVVSGATGSATAGASAEAGLQTNQAITGNGFDGNEVLEAAVISGVTGGALGAGEGAIVKKIGENLPDKVKVKGFSRRMDNYKEGLSTYTENTVDIARDSCEESGRCED